MRRVQKAWRIAVLWGALSFVPAHAAVQTSLSYDYLGRVIQASQQGQTEDYFYSGEKRVFKKEASGKKRLYLFEDHSVVFDREVEFGKRGDADGTGTWTITDAVYLINYIFAGGPLPKPSLLAGDADGNSIITIGDAVWLINFIFAGGPAPSSATLSLAGAANVFAPGAGRIWSDGAMGNEDLYFVEDSVSSTSAVLAGNALGEVIHSTPFGEQLTTSNLEKRYLFTGKELDATTGLSYYGARYYDSALGRFLQWDSVMDGANRYLYVRNNPINANDPSGHEGGLVNPVTLFSSMWSNVKSTFWESFKSEFIKPRGTPLYEMFPGVRDQLDVAMGQLEVAKQFGDPRTKIGAFVSQRLLGAITGTLMARAEELPDMSTDEGMEAWAQSFVMGSIQFGGGFKLAGAKLGVKPGALATLEAVDYIGKSKAVQSSAGGTFGELITSLEHDPSVLSQQLMNMRPRVSILRTEAQRIEGLLESYGAHGADRASLGQQIVTAQQKYVDLERTTLQEIMQEFQVTKP